MALARQQDGGSPIPEARPGEAGEFARILAVDDDPANLIAIQAILGELEQPIVCVRSGEEALRRLLKEEFAVILLDVLMPGLDGYETAAIIRARERTKHVPIIFLSAVNKESGHLARGYAAGAVDFVFKPVDPLMLRSKVAVFIELHKRAQEIRRQAEHEKRLLADNLLVRTEQMRTEAALERSLAQQSAVIEALPLALYTARSVDEFRSRKLVGGRLEGLVGHGGDVDGEIRNWFDWVHPDDRPRILSAFEEATETKVFSAEYRLKCRDGAYRWFSDRATFSKTDRREQFGILLDITERRRLEEQLVHAQKIEAIGQMTGGIAHDFNNMLSVIIGSLDRALAMPIEDERLSSRLNLAMQAAVSCADLTKRLLSFARRQALEPKGIRLCDELIRLEKILARLLEERIPVEMTCESEVWPVYLDASQLEAAIVNLVINARDAMPGGGAIRITALNRPAGDAALAGLDLPQGDYVELAVADSGSGMSEEVKAHAFEPFFTTKEAGRGTGLGLSSIYGFMRQSGGTVTIDSELGTGTTVRLFLPRALDERRRGARRRRKPPQQRMAGADPARILLVEDEEKVRALAASMLEELGVDVVSAANGDEAARLFEQDAGISALFTDCMMPGTLDGPRLAESLRSRIPDLPVLFTSGFLGMNSIEMNWRGIAFLRKPYSAAELADALAALGIPVNAPAAAGSA